MSVLNKLRLLQAPLFLSGVASIPFTFFLSRSGYISLALVVICVLVLIAYTQSKPNDKTIFTLIKYFILGVFTSELLSFIYWKLSNNFESYGLNFYLYIGAIEFGIISFIGIMCISVIKILSNIQNTH